jgi:hypothetical protein
MRILLHLVFAVGSVCTASAQDLSIEIQNINTATGTFDVYMDSTAEIAGLQFDVGGVTLTNVAGGLIDAATFDTSFNPANGRILSFGFGTTIAAGASDVLLTVGFDCSPGTCASGVTVCITNEVFSDPMANALAVGVGPCVESGLGTPFCVGTENSTGAPALLTSFGSLSIAAADLMLVAAPVPNEPFVFFAGPNAIQVPFGDGFRCVGGSLTRLWPPALASGNVATRTIDPGAYGLIAATHHVQCWFRDPSGAGGSGFNLTSGMTVVLTP